MLNEVIDIIVEAVSFCLATVKVLFDATGTTKLWIAGISFTVVFSVLILPLRGGQSVTLNGFSGFLANKINRHRKQSKTDSDD